MLVKTCQFISGLACALVGGWLSNGVLLFLGVAIMVLAALSDGTNE